MQLYNRMLIVVQSRFRFGCLAYTSDTLSAVANACFETSVAQNKTTVFSSSAKGSSARTFLSLTLKRHLCLKLSATSGFGKKGTMLACWKKELKWFLSCIFRRV